MFIVNRLLPQGPQLGLHVEVHRQESRHPRVEVTDIPRQGPVHHRNDALEQTAGLVERPLRIRDLIVEVNGEDTIDGITAQLQNLESLQLCMRIERPRKPRELSLLEVQEHLAGDFTYWMQQCQCRFITLKWEEVLNLPWDDVRWRVSGRDAFPEVLDFVHVAFTDSVFLYRWEHISDMPHFVQQVFNSDLHFDRMESSAHPNQRNLAQLGDAILLMNLDDAESECRKYYRQCLQRWQSFRVGSVALRAASRGLSADLFTDWELDQRCQFDRSLISGAGRETQHRRSTVVETVIAELWLHLQDEAAPDNERTKCGAMLTFMTHHILWRQLERELHHPDDLTHGLAQNFPLWY